MSSLLFGPWGWVILGLVLIGGEVLAPGIFLLWLGLAALLTGAVVGLELQGAEAIRRAHAPAKRVGLDLEHPHVGRFRMAELVGLAAALQEESARPARHLATALGKEHLRLCRMHGGYGH